MENKTGLIVAVVVLILSSCCCFTGIGGFLLYTRSEAATTSGPTPYIPPATGGGGAGGGGSALVPGSPGNAGQQLALGQRQSNYGLAAVAPGSIPAPTRIVSGPTAQSSVALGDLGIRPVNSGSCRGYATQAPDIIVDVSATLPSLRFIVEAEAGGDTTLVIHHNGQFWCSDDDGDGFNPLVTMTNADAGQYDVWVGSYAAGRNINTTFSVGL